MATLGAVDTGEYARVTSGVGVPALVDTGEYARVTSGVGTVGLVNTGDPPLVFSHTTSGGVRLTGSAPRSFVLNGVPTNDTTSYVITTSGGLLATGTAPVSAVITHRYEIYPGGQVRLTATAPVAINGIRFATSGGVKLTGSAPASIVSNGVVGGISAARTKFTASFGLAGIYGNCTPFTAAFGPEGNSLLATQAGYTSAFGPELTVPYGTFAATQTQATASFYAVAGSAGGFSTQSAKHTAVFEGGSVGLAGLRPQHTASFVGLTGLIGAVSASVVKYTASLTAQTTVVGTITAQQVTRVASLSAFYGTVATLAATRSVHNAALVGAAGVQGSLQARVTVSVGAFSGLSAVTGTMAVVLPQRVSEFRAEYLAQQIATLVVNTITDSVTTFDNYAFNSFAEFGGRYLAAGPGGLSELDDITSTEKPVATMKTAQLHFGSEYQKRVSDFYFAMRSESDIVLRVFTDENEPYEYVLSSNDITTLKQGRSLIGKGARGKYWQFEIEASEQFDFDTMNIAAVAVSRRI